MQMHFDYKKTKDREIHAAEPKLAGKRLDPM
jgi:hypothetical protein